MPDRSYRQLVRGHQRAQRQLDQTTPRDDLFISSHLRSFCIPNPRVRRGIRQRLEQEGNIHDCLGFCPDAYMHGVVQPLTSFESTE